MRRILALAAAAGLSACTVGPNFVQPQPKLGSQFVDTTKNPDAAVATGSNPDPLWWNQFHDKVLTGLMKAAIADNPSLQEGILRVVESRQSVVSAQAAGLPTLSGNGSYMREQLGVKGILESKGAYNELNALADQNSPLNEFSPGLGTEIGDQGKGLLNGLGAPVNLFQYGLSSSWELDLFGKVRRSVESAKASAQAQAEAANDALVMLESEVAQSYVQMREAQNMALQQQISIAAAQQSLNLTQSRAAAGLTSDLDVEQARSELLAEQEQLPNYETQAQEAINQLDVLTGQPPGTLDALLQHAEPLPAIPAVVGVGVPSALAERRPDIREAADELHADIAQIGEADANFYPDITLTGSIGLRALDASYLTNWASLFYSAGPSISLPIFEGGQLTANLRMARAQAAAAALNYRATVLNALREVENALVSYRNDQTAAQSAAGTVQSAALSLYLAHNQYTHGLTSFLNVLDAQRTIVSARQQLVQADATLANDVATLYTSLGGGWQDRTKDIPTPAVNPAPPPLPAAADSLADMQ
jgi:NodT family efflux transporter outer membrane factor (OMF) lipoprotein